MYTSLTLYYKGAHFSLKKGIKPDFLCVGFTFFPHLLNWRKRTVFQMHGKYIQASSTLK